MNAPPEPLSEIVSDINAYARSRGLQTSDARDVAQETVTRMLEQPSPPEEARAWCFRTAKNLMSDRHRASSRAATGARLTEPLEQHEAPSPAELHQTVEDLTLVALSLGDLPHRQQAVIKMIDLDGMSAADAGASLGLDARATRQLRHRAHKSLRSSYLARGGTVGGLALLLPSLQGTSRLRGLAALAAVPVLLVALAITWMPVVPRAADSPAPRFDGDAYVVREDLNDRAALRLAAHDRSPAPLGATAPGESGGAGAASPLAHLVVLFVPRCDDVGHTTAPAVCHGRGGYDPDAYAVGVGAPLPVCLPDPVGCNIDPLVVTQDQVDPRPACPTLQALAPGSVCQKGY